jgi:hypothetical protein
MKYDSLFQWAERFHKLAVAPYPLHVVPPDAEITNAYSGNRIDDPIGFLVQAISSGEKYPGISFYYGEPSPDPETPERLHLGGVDFALVNKQPSNLGAAWYWAAPPNGSLDHFDPTKPRYNTLRSALVHSFKEHPKSGLVYILPQDRSRGVSLAGLQVRDFFDNDEFLHTGAAEKWWHELLGRETVGKPFAWKGSDDPLTPVPEEDEEEESGLVGLAKTIHEIAASIPMGDPRRFGRYKVFLSAIFGKLTQTDAELLWEAARAGLIQLSRADLTAAMDPAMVKASEMYIVNGKAYAGVAPRAAGGVGVFHFLNMPETQTKMSQASRSLDHPNAPNVDMGEAKKLMSQYEAHGLEPRVLCLVPISEIKQTATYMTDEMMEGYASLLEGSPMPPPELELDGRGRLSINDGAHRIKAAEKLGFSHVPALVPANYAGIERLPRLG